MIENITAKFVGISTNLVEVDTECTSTDDLICNVLKGKYRSIVNNLIDNSTYVFLSINNSVNIPIYMKSIGLNINIKSELFIDSIFSMNDLVTVVSAMCKYLEPEEFYENKFLSTELDRRHYDVRVMRAKNCTVKEILETLDITQGQLSYSIVQNNHLKLVMRNTMYPLIKHYLVDIKGWGLPRVNTVYNALCRVGMNLENLNDYTGDDISRIRSIGPKNASIILEFVYYYNSLLS